MQPIDHYRISIFLTALTTGALALFVLLAAHRIRLIRVYCLYEFTICAWATCWFKMVTATSIEMNLFYGRLLHVPAVFVPLGFLIFVQIFLGIEGQAIQRRIRRGVGIGSLLCLIMFPLDAFISSAKQKVGFPYFLEPGPLYAVYVTFFFVVVGYVFYLLIRGYKTSSGFLKVQISHLLGAYTIGYLGAVGVFLPIYGIPMPTISIYMIAMAHLWIFYAILRHRLLDIRIVIRRTGLLLLIYLILVIVLIPVLKKLNGESSIPLGEILMAGLVLSLGPFLYALVVRRSTYFHDETIAGVTHELKTPLAAIQSALEVLELQSSSGDANAKTAYMNIIRTNASRLQGFTESLVQLFGNDDSPISLHRKPADLRQLCTQTVHRAQELATQKGIQVYLDVPDSEITAVIDSAKIEQVLSNLFSNALKFTDQGSITLTLRSTTEEAQIAIADTGIGLRPDEVPRIFDRFYQGEAGRSKKGTGIGLTLAKNWVEAHGGKIWAESGGEGKGVTVTFILLVS